MYAKINFPSSIYKYMKLIPECWITVALRQKKYFTVKFDCKNQAADWMNQGVLCAYVFWYAAEYLMPCATASNVAAKKWNGKGITRKKNEHKTSTLI